ncbi:MAG: hypothetical protein A3C90_04195 [Candidatus Magasanikbacteria bacterium RIFCSPHIGHO2_02_FULL_51_14]|uniref:PpiC domain-containing protein n=1 Tax=Candidatus Magasanikbacteria bacterium RIFCSPHIGHO2_02_FULL_51_14 TaxID=1798683 RepID=A0A1F6MDP4_9BACT|nr:MAG: hypothetical protein A3C90_04195 [Candidatus Magasanikbacteria bacterium RIFCSPHIGHO2_02_FULL_51_14]
MDSMQEDIQQAGGEPHGSALPGKPRGRSAFTSFALGLVVVIVLAGVGTAGYGWMQVKKLSQDPFVLKIAEVLRFSVAKMNGVAVPYAEYVEDIGVLNKFYASQPEEIARPTDEQVSDQVLSRLVANALIGSIAAQFNVTVTDEKLETAKKDLLAQFPDEATASSELFSRYGWTLDTYLNKVIVPLLREQELQTAFETSDDERAKEFQKEEIRARHILFAVGEDDNEDTVKRQAQSVLERIEKGEDFATLAAEFGSDATKDEGGDLGWFGRGDMVPEFEQAVFALGAGELGKELVRSQFGYHIVRVDEKRTINDFIAFMDKQLRSAEIKVLLPVHNPFENLTTDPEDTDATDTDNEDA